jgi:hypothetical protein
VTAGRAEEARVECRVLYETQDGLYVDAGRGAGLLQNAAGQLLRGAEKVAHVEVVKAGDESTYLRIVSRDGIAPRAGETLTLVFDRTPAEESAPGRPQSPTIKSDEEEGAPFVPLLAPLDLSGQAATEASNIFHGTLTVGQLFQMTTDGDNDAYITSLRTSGSLERIGSSPWTFEWSGALYYRDGEGLEDVRYYQELQLLVHRLAFYRRFDDRSFVRLGRFIPLELPSAGYLDGIQGEKVVSENVRVGGMFGLKPRRYDLEFSVDEPTVVPYATFEAGERSDTYYSGTFGALFSLFDGEASRLAILGEQAFQTGRFSAICSSAIDIDVGSALERSPVSVTQLDLLLTYDFSPGFTLRGGVDHYELPDNAGEQDVIDPASLNLDEFFEDSWWRYWVGASHELGGGFRLTEEVGYVQSDADDGVRWVVTLTRTGLPGLPDGSISLSAFNLDGVGSDGYGGRLSAYLPFLRHRLLIMPAVSARWINFETEGEVNFPPVEEDLLAIDASLRAQWFITNSWSLSGGVSYAYTDEEDRFLVDLALTFRW